MSLDIIERAVQLWSNPGDIVFTPFAGIGSECYQAIKMYRKAIGVELKESYFNTAATNLKNLSDEMASEVEDLLS
jgi:DNA modification methylase